MNVLFVCKANVGRSQMAEAIFNKNAPGRHTANSAGVEALGSDGTDLDGMPLPKRASSKYVLECLREIGIDVSDRTIKRLTPAMVHDADRIIVMVRPETSPEFLNNDAKVTYWDLEDPDEQPLEYYRETRDAIRTRVEKLIEEINQDRSA